MITLTYELDIRKPVILLRLRILDPLVDVGFYDFNSTGLNGAIVVKHGLLVDSFTLTEAQVAVAVNTLETAAETQAIMDYLAASAGFKALPNWSTMTAAGAEAYINSNIWNGLTQTQVNTYVDSKIVNITTANVNQINTQLENIRTVIKAAAGAVIAVRTILSIIAKGIIYLRDLIVR